MKTYPGALKGSLDDLYRAYDFRARLPHDPVEIPRRYGTPEDRETAGFIAACFAYGRVDLFKPVLEGILSAMGESPYRYLLDFDLKKDAPRFAGIRYRFATNDDILMLLLLLSSVTKRRGGIEGIFMSHFRGGGGSLRDGLIGLVDTLNAIAEECTGAGRLRLSGFSHFLPSPRGGSACKRLNLFLRWMARDRDIDLGIWKALPKSSLVVPLDTHLLRVGRCLGFTARASADWKTAEEITAALREIDPEDPLRFDFALCHLGISGECGPDRCERCRLRAYSVHSRRCGIRGERDMAAQRRGAQLRKAMEKTR